MFSKSVCPKELDLSGAKMVESEDVEVEEVPQEVKILLPYTYKPNGLRDVFKKREKG